MAQTLLDLSKLISDAAAHIDSVCKARNTTFPSLDEPFNPATEAIRMDPEVMGSLATLTSSADQLIATAWVPALTLLSTTLSFHISSAIRVASECNVAEALREAGPQGLHVKDIANGHVVQPEKLARVLRLLATKHFIREVAPDVFATSKLISLIDTGKPLAEVRSNPHAKHAATNGTAAFVEHSSDEVYKGASYMADALLNPNTAHSDSPNETALALAFGFKGGVWEWFEQPANAHRLARFGTAMTAASAFMPDEAILTGFEWQSLPKGATIVDVGGGVGSAALVLDNALQDVNIFVQDRATVVEDARKFWQQKKPSSLECGKVVIEAHDFFEPQPRRNVDVFVLRHILHDWSDPYASKILKQLRAAAKESTRLVFVEQLLLYACYDPSTGTSSVVGAAELGGPLPPAPLLPNMGIVNLTSYLTDMQMLTGFNSGERTLAQFEVLLTASGWKIEKLQQSPGTWKHITARPIF